MITPRTDHLIDLALEEDAGLGDVTSRAIFPAAHRSRAVIDVKQAEVVVCGLEVAARVFARVDPALKTTLLARDGDRLKSGADVLRIEGPTAALLTAERTALNFMQRLTGIATVRWLRPSYSSAEEMISLARQITGRGVPLLNLLFHSSEAIAGTSPYTRNESELAGFFDRLSRALEFMIGTLGARPLTFAEFHREFGATAGLAPVGATD